jgi:serine/threonine protein kinase
MTVSEIAQPRTIAERIASEGIPIADALRYAMLLAEALRGIHDTGRVYGALCPASVALTESGLELLPALPPTSAVTPYTAPEVAAGGPPTARSDIFSFGAVAYEMLTGRPAFQGESPEVLAESILRSNPRPSGVPSADRFLRYCLERDPCARFQHMQKVVLELKVLMVVSHCSQADTARAREAATVLDRIDASEKDLKAQGALIESTRVAVGHIEGLLEGVVEAIEALQCAVLEQQGEGSLAVR